jgi:glycerophosphoryl diester phosphodiesterase
MPKGFWDNSSWPLAIAHRGGDGAGQGKRNTMAAFRAAGRLGYGYFETDVINTKDGQVIIAHGALNPLTARLRDTFSCKTLQSLTYAEIKASLRVSGEKIPLLEDLLRAFPNGRFLIDPKTDEVMAPLAELLIKLKVLDRVCVGSFRYGRVKHMNSLLKSKAATGLIIGRNNWLKYLPRLKTGRLAHVQAVYLHHSFVSRPMLSLIRRHGFKVLVWTPNSPLGIKHAIRCGADGVISDRVGLLKEIIESK